MISIFIVTQKKKKRENFLSYLLGQKVNESLSLDQNLHLPDTHPALCK